MWTLLAAIFLASDCVKVNAQGTPAVSKSTFPRLSIHSTFLRMQLHERHRNLRGMSYRMGVEGESQQSRHRQHLLQAHRRQSQGTVSYQPIFVLQRYMASFFFPSQGYAKLFCRHWGAVVVDRDFQFSLRRRYDLLLEQFQNTTMRWEKQRVSGKASFKHRFLLHFLSASGPPATTTATTASGASPPASTASRKRPRRPSTTTWASSIRPATTAVRSVVWRSAPATRRRPPPTRWPIATEISITPFAESTPRCVGKNRLGALMKCFPLGMSRGNDQGGAISGIKKTTIHCKAIRMIHWHSKLQIDLLPSLANKHSGLLNSHMNSVTLVC